jgi:hypothetical protein
MQASGHATSNYQSAVTFETHTIESAAYASAQKHQVAIAANHTKQKHKFYKTAPIAATFDVAA